ncbi:MAG: hypothetical protein H0W65_11660 [Sphingomonas sp.]|uniref:hypothetical protein n=1 Tax=Sphingomonas sp. TaxID=28214 RepID=UPI00179CF59D|nr:hypothetical protein [Sphingomonas sp.]MBA3668354.1 hypothetical protein [Sphingomonas sp.]
MDQELKSKRTQTFFDATCTPAEAGRPGSIRRDTNGALLLINNYVLTYRCQRDRAAEGRQFFEVPSFLTAAAAATAAAFGAGAGVTIGAGATGAILNQGKSYYAPRDKAAVLNDGLNALLCIQNEAVGIDPYTLKTLSAAQEAGGTPEPGQPVPTISGAGRDGDETPQAEPQVTISSQRQYFEMIRSALFSVESVVAQRLSAAGTPFDAAGVIAEVEALNKKADEEQAEAGDAATAGQAAKTAATPPDSAAAGVQPAAAIERLISFTAAKAKLQRLSDDQVGRTVIKLRTLQPKLDKCVVRAKV